MSLKLAILVNLGTPESLEPRVIRAWLGEFLSDPRVVNLPRPLWLPLLYLFVLPFRPRRVQEKYREIWQEDSPLRLLTNSLAARVGTLLSAEDWEVRVAMTYGVPSLDTVLEDANTFERTVILPLYPQYCGATTGAIFDRVGRVLARQKVLPNIQLINSYFERADYTAAIAAGLGKGAGDSHTVFSFHGTPVSQAIHEAYEAHCHATAAAIAAAANLADGSWEVSFQSRFGPTAWLEPYTEDVLIRLGRAGRPVRVVCPGFAVDCLETLEEIDISYRAVYLDAGGTRFEYIPALNDSADHAELLASVVRNGGT